MIVRLWTDRRGRPADIECAEVLAAELDALASTPRHPPLSPSSIDSLKLQFQQQRQLYIQFKQQRLEQHQQHQEQERLKLKQKREQSSPASEPGEPTEQTEESEPDKVEEPL